MPQVSLSPGDTSNPGRCPTGVHWFKLPKASSFTPSQASSEQSILPAMPHKVLHLLSQRPSLTGSGITLDALARHAGSTGYDQRVVIGVPHDDATPSVGTLDDDHIYPLRFGTRHLGFPVPGMSDVMPYSSTRFSAMNEKQLSTYKEAWLEHLASVARVYTPEVIHSHHLWILSSLIHKVFPKVPVITHCHATGLRQMQLNEHLKDEVIGGLKTIDRFAVLHDEHARQVVTTLGVPHNIVHVVGAGFRQDLFNCDDRAPTNGRQLLYAGKFSNAKGLPWLLDAFENLASQDPELTLHIAGSGSGDEADAIRSRLESLAPRVVVHGMLDQAGLAKLMRQSDLFVLPSFYEGLPLVLVEALACGCRLVSTNLACVEALAPHIGEALDVALLPRLVGPDIPVEEDLPDFVDSLERAILGALDKPKLDTTHLASMLAPFTWGAVFERVETIWQQLVTQKAQ